MKKLTQKDRVSLVRTLVIVPIIIIVFYITLAIIGYIITGGSSEGLVMALIIIHLILYWIYKFAKAFINNNLPFIDFEK